MAWIGAIIGGALSAFGSSDAASQVSGSADRAAQLQLQLAHEGEGLTAPGRNLGYGADNLLAGLFGMPTPYGGPGSIAPYGSTPMTPGTPASGVPVGDRTSAGGFPSGYGNNLITGYGMYGNGSGGLTTNPNGGSVPATAGKNPATPGYNPMGGKPDYSSFFSSPGYQFTLKAGEDAMNRSASANGGLYSENELTQQNNWAQGQASTHYNDYVNQLLQMAGLGSAGVSTAVGANSIAGQGASNSLITGGLASGAGTAGTFGGINSALTGSNGNNGLIAALRASNNGGGNGFQLDPAITAGNNGFNMPAQQITGY